jgi:hypothetical protein
MVGMEHVSRSDPLEIDVLTALMSGVASAADVALRTGQSETVVTPILERCVAEQAVTRIDLRRTQAYSLTPKGMHAVALSQGVPEAVDHTTAPEQVARPVGEGAMEPPHEPPAASSPSPVDASDYRGKADRGHQKVIWRHVVYAVAYVLVGLFLMLLQPVIGLLAVLAGIVLGAFALRPLWRSRDKGFTTR